MVDYFKFLFCFCVSILLSFYFVTAKEMELVNEVNNQIRYLSDAIYRYQINVFNSHKDTTKNINSEYFILFKNENENENDTVNVISQNIDSLYTNIQQNPIIKDKLWTVADIYNRYMYIKPFRKEYKELISRHSPNGGYFKYLLDIENIELNLKKNKSDLYETIKVYGPYLEEGTKASLYSIYYPLYFDRKVQSILLMDIESTFLSDFIDEFNKNNLTWFTLNNDYEKLISNYIFNILAQESYDTNISLPIRINYLYFISLSLFIHLLIYMVIILVNRFMKYINNNKLDKLTGFYRKDHFNNTNPMVNCILVVDIDHFKKINDTYGHPVGDKVINEVSERIRATIRTSDIGIRWGGEEFVIILDGKINVCDLKNRLNELLKIISDEPIFNISVTISIGAISSTEGIVLSDAFKLADDALYVSKREGRNRFTISGVDKDN